MKNIYLIRHGETEYNHLGLVQGSGIDSNLNRTGLKQADAFFEYFKNIDFDKIYTSKLKRTHQSVNAFIEMGIPWEQLSGLNEISWGHKEGRLITQQDNEQYASMLLAWKRGDYHQKVPGGESPLEVQTRQKEAWAHIMLHENEENILVCMHGRAIRILLCYLMDVPLKEMDQFEHTNLCLYHLQYSNHQYRIIKSCYTEHLHFGDSTKGSIRKVS